MVFKVEISGQGVTDKWVEIYDQLGDRTLKRFTYDSNALEVNREESSSEIFTALIGRGKGEQVSSGEDNPSGQAGYG
ncbi:phage tail spike protein, partial [Salmonella enterica]|uniref:phage tail spike protein n=1 Tax=Salmonella enterica TaxID=28901 RepID=UPI0014837F79